jgi:metacaspase-1
LKLRVLCVHTTVEPAGSSVEPAWREAMQQSLQRSGISADLDLDFLDCSDLFVRSPPGIAQGVALAQLLASSVWYGAEDLLQHRRGLSDLPALVRNSADMIAHWATDRELRLRGRTRIQEALRTADYHVVVAHSIGSLICYDTFVRDTALMKSTALITLGSQIGNPALRGVFGGRLVGGVSAAGWFHLHNPNDHVFAGSVPIQTDNVRNVETEFDTGDNELNHEAARYLAHREMATNVWPQLVGRTNFGDRRHTSSPLHSTDTSRTHSNSQAPAPLSSRDSELRQAQPSACFTFTK